MFPVKIIIMTLEYIGISYNFISLISRLASFKYKFGLEMSFKMIDFQIKNLLLIVLLVT